MNRVLLIARYQFLASKRATKGNLYFSVALLVFLMCAMCYFAPFYMLYLALPVFSFYALNSVSLSLLRSNYELDPANISIYPFSRSQRFSLLYILDLLNISGAMYVLSFVILLVICFLRFDITEALMLFASFTIYWLFFAGFYLMLRTFCRRNYTFFYIIRFGGSVIVFGFLILKSLSKSLPDNRRPLAVILDAIRVINPLYFLLSSIVVLGILFFIIDKLFAYYVNRNPFPDSQLPQKFITARWR